MSVRFDGIDLNSDALAVEQNDLSPSESMEKGTGSGAKTLTDLMGGGQVDQGLVSLKGLSSSELEVSRVQNDSKSNVGHFPFLANDVRAEMGSMGVSPCIESAFSDKNGGVGQVVDKTKEKLVDEGQLKSGSEINGGGPEIKHDVDNPAHLGDGEGPRINGIVSKGNQEQLRQELTIKIEQPQDIQMESAEEADSKIDSRMIEFQKFQTEKGLFHPGDLVWGKVRSHPWWPGQVFDPSDASEKARKYSRKDGFLIGYFGDETFAWNEASQIKPFRLLFSRMEKQSNTESFNHAVDCALQEVSRRVQFGLACSCSPEERYDKIKTQVVVNAGIQEESSRRDGSDEFSDAAAFRPVKLLQCLQALAHCPLNGIDRLEFITARSQLQAFSSWKGFHELPEFQMLSSWPEDVAESPTTEETGDVSGLPEDDAVDFPKKKLTNQESTRGKRKKTVGNGLSPSKKEKRLSDLNHLTTTSGSNISTRRSNEEGTSVGRVTSSSIKRSRKQEAVADELETKIKKISVSPASERKLIRVGESIRKVARQLYISSKSPEEGHSGKTSGENGRKRQPKTGPGKSKKRKVITAECPPPAEMLSQLHMVAIDPLAGLDLAPTVGFFSGFRNSICLENSTSQDIKNSHADVSGELTPKDTSKEKSTEADRLKGYWTDRIVQADVEERVIFEVETSSAVVKDNLDGPVEAAEPGPKLISEDGTDTVNFELDGKPAAADAHEKLEEEQTPTALILNFTNPESVPPESNLMKIFSQYGPLCEPGIELPKNTKRAKVIFRRRCDAETAFSSAGKFSVFGHSLVSYRLHYAPTPQRKSSPAKRSRKGSTSKKPVQLN